MVNAEMAKFAGHGMEQKCEIIPKPASLFKKPVNMPAYDEAYKNFNWKDHEKDVEWFGDPSQRKINAAYNAVTRHMKTKTKNKIALRYEGANGEKRDVTYAELEAESNKFANALVRLGIKKGDRVFIFLPRIPEVHVCFLGILKTGAIAGTMFSAFGPGALKDRLENSDACVVITDKLLKPRVDEIRPQLPHLKHVISVNEPDGGQAPLDANKGELLYKEITAKESPSFKCVETSADDPAFLLYTSGSTGKPKGVVHVHGGIVQQQLSAKWVLDLHEDDVYWCTADHGWVTGVVYMILGPLCVGCTSVMFDGRYSTEKWYNIIEENKVNIWYTAPTAIRMLMKDGLETAAKHDFSSLRHIYSVGEPLNPEAIRWGMQAFNGLAFHDTWWQTETGAMMICNYPSDEIRLGAMGKPFPGTIAGIIDENGNELGHEKEGDLALRPGWPSMMKAIWNNPEKYASYFKNGWYVVGDRALTDKDGWFWFVGRADDVIKTAGERVGPFEVESALVEHPAIAEAGVIGKPDALRGEIVKAFVTLRQGFAPSEELKKEISQFIKKKLSAHEYPREIEFVDKLPKTRSGKIMRRMLRAKEMGLPIGDTSTLED